MAKAHDDSLGNSRKSIQKCTSLLWYLASQGHTRDEINRLIQDIFNVIREGGSFTIAMVNREMNARGWPAEVVDETSFEILISLMEDELGYSVTSHTIN